MEFKALLFMCFAVFFLAFAKYLFFKKMEKKKIHAHGLREAALDSEIYSLEPSARTTNKTTFILF